MATADEAEAVSKRITTVLETHLERDKVSFIYNSIKLPICNNNFWHITYHITF